MRIYFASRPFLQPFSIRYPGKHLLSAEKFRRSVSSIPSSIFHLYFSAIHNVCPANQFTWIIYHSFSIHPREIRRSSASEFSFKMILIFSVWSCACKNLNFEAIFRNINISSCLELLQLFCLSIYRFKIWRRHRTIWKFWNKFLNHWQGLFVTFISRK